MKIKPILQAQAIHPSYLRVETRRLQVQGLPGIQNEFKTKHAGCPGPESQCHFKAKQKEKTRKDVVSISIITTSEFISKIESCLAP